MESTFFACKQAAFFTPKKKGTKLVFSPKFIRRLISPPVSGFAYVHLDCWLIFFMKSKGPLSK
jgi:hypothetical protein